MPRRDGTGPMGMGAMTGRGLGVCTGVNAPIYGRGFGRGLGLGFGRCFGFGANSNYNQTASKEALQAQKEQLQITLDAIDKRLESL
jgi:hypothetical protein